MLYSKKTTQGTVYECLFFVLLTNHCCVYALVFPCSTFVYYLLMKGKREEEEEAKNFYVYKFQNSHVHSFPFLVPSNTVSTCCATATASNFSAVSTTFTTRIAAVLTLPLLIPSLMFALPCSFEICLSYKSS